MATEISTTEGPAMDVETEREYIGELEAALRKFSKQRDVHIPRKVELARFLFEETLQPAVVRVAERSAR